MSAGAVGESVAHRYRIVEAIGRGGLGTVYKAVDTRLHRLVALKVLPFTPDADSRQRFLKEAQVLASLSHPNIVQIYDVGDTGDSLYLAVEYVEGRNLRQIIVDSQRFELDYVLEIVFQVSIALGYAHRHGIIHRDIKPENIMISTDGRVLLLDFGLAIAPGEPTITHIGTILGTVAYMSPEQVLGNPVDARSDIFSLGLVFYELLTGRRAFSAESLPNLIRNIIEQVPAPPGSIEQTIPLAIDEFAMKLLAKEPDQRFQTIDQVLSTLSTTKRSLLEETTPSTALADYDRNLLDRAGQAHGLHLGKISATFEEGPTPHSAFAAIRRSSMGWLVSGSLALVLGVIAVTQHSLKIALYALVSATVASLFFYGRNLLGSKRENPPAAVPPVALPPPPLIRHSTFEVEEPTAEFLPLSPSSAPVPEALKIAQDVFDRYKTLFAQSESRADIPEDVTRRLEEFDTIWDQLTASARHD